MIEEDQGNLTVANDDGNESSDEETREKKNAPTQQAQKFVENYEIQSPKWDMETVIDWGVRIANYDARQKEFYNNMVPKMIELKGIAKSEQGWDLIVDAKNDRIKIECKRSIRGLLMMRAQGPIDAPAIDIWRCMMYQPFRKEWDMNNDKSQWLAKMGANGYQAYKKTKKKAVVSARDFVVD